MDAATGLPPGSLLRFTERSCTGAPDAGPADGPARFDLHEGRPTTVKASYEARPGRDGSAPAVRGGGHVAAASLVPRDASAETPETAGKAEPTLRRALSEIAAPEDQRIGRSVDRRL